MGTNLRSDGLSCFHCGAWASTSKDGFDHVYCPLHAEMWGDRPKSNADPFAGLTAAFGKVGKALSRSMDEMMVGMMEKEAAKPPARGYDTVDDARECMVEKHHAVLAASTVTGDGPSAAWMRSHSECTFFQQDRGDYAPEMRPHSYVRGGAPGLGSFMFVDGIGVLHGYLEGGQSIHEILRHKCVFASKPPAPTVNGNAYGWRNIEISFDGKTIGPSGMKPFDYAPTPMEIEDTAPAQTVDVWRAGQVRRLVGVGTREDKEDGGLLVLIQAETMTLGMWTACDLRGEHWTANSKQKSTLTDAPHVLNAGRPFGEGQWRRGKDERGLDRLLLVLRHEGGARWTVRDLEEHAFEMIEDSSMEVLYSPSVHLPSEGGAIGRFQPATDRERLARFKFDVREKEGCKPHPLDGANAGTFSNLLGPMKSLTLDSMKEAIRDLKDLARMPVKMLPSLFSGDETDQEFSKRMRATWFPSSVARPTINGHLTEVEISNRQRLADTQRSAPALFPVVPEYQPPRTQSQSIGAGVGVWGMRDPKPVVEGKPYPHVSDEDLLPDA